MAESEQPAAGRARGAFQPIEALDDSGGHQIPPIPPVPALAPTGRHRPDPAPASSGPASTGAQLAAAPPPPPALGASAVRFAARFSSAASALGFTGLLLAAGGTQDPAFRHGSDRSWWVSARLELDIVREFSHAARGEAYIEAAPGRLLPDRGWGEPPSSMEDEDPTEILWSDLAEVGLLDLVRVAGLHPYADRATAEISLFLPGRLLANVVRRAVDLRLTVAHRPVRLSPLFTDQQDGSAPESTPATLIELRVTAVDGEIPRGFLLALARDPQHAVCRRAGVDGTLLIEYGMATALPDHLLAGLIGSQVWLLSRGKLGGRRVESVNGFSDSTALLRLSDGYPIDTQVAVDSDSGTELPPVRIVRARTPGVGVDALLLADGELETARLLLEGHPLAEIALFVRGRDRHLLLASGGLLEALPIGEALYCLGPGPLYLPVGFGTRPKLPPSARQALFEIDSHSAVVALSDLAVRFDLARREPVWRLWVGAPPPVQEALPLEIAQALRDVSDPVAAEPQKIEELGSLAVVQQSRAAWFTRRRRAAPTGETAESTPQRTLTWRDEALTAELHGQLAQAAELHLRHGDPVRAAHLFERAAREAGG